MPPKKAADAGAGEEAKFKKTKPAAKALSAAEAASDVAQGASMARNAEIVKFLESVAQGYHDSAEWMKKANANKAARAVKALTTPIAVARQLSALEGCGKGTIEKVAAFLEANPVAAPEAVAAQADDEDAFIKNLERDIVIGMLVSGDLTLARVTRQRQDVAAGDF